MVCRLPAKEVLPSLLALHQMLTVRPVSMAWAWDCLLRRDAHGYGNRQVLECLLRTASARVARTSRSKWLLSPLRCHSSSSFCAPALLNITIYLSSLLSW